MSHLNIPPETLAELRDLVAARWEDRLTAQQAARLEELTAGSEEIARLYVGMIFMHAELRHFGPMLMDKPDTGIAPVQTNPLHELASAAASRRTVRSPSRAAGVDSLKKASIFTGSRFSAWRIAAIFVFIASAVFMLTSPTWTGWWRSTPVATLADAVDAQWDAPQTRLDVGDHLPYGPLYLKSGYASIRLDNGVKLVVVGPAHFSVDSLRQIKLDEGKLTADVPHTSLARGFAVKIPSGLVTDLGTTFGVTAFANTESTVQVLKGSVQAQLFSDDGKPKNQIVLTENHAEALSPITGVMASIPVEPDAYVTNIRAIHAQLAVHNTGAELKPGDADPNWKITANTDDAAWTARPAIVGFRTIGGWYPPGDVGPSQWLSTAQNWPALNVGCQLTYATTIDLTGVEPATAQLHLVVRTDNDLVELRLNGKKTGISFICRTNEEVITPHLFTLDHGFIAGKNTLEFVVGNGPASTNSSEPNPMGLRVELDGGAIQDSSAIIQNGEH